MLQLIVRLYVYCKRVSQASQKPRSLGHSFCIENNLKSINQYGQLFTAYTESPCP